MFLFFPSQVYQTLSTHSRQRRWSGEAGSRHSQSTAHEEGVQSYERAAQVMYSSSHKMLKSFFHCVTFLSNIIFFISSMYVQPEFVV